MPVLSLMNLPWEIIYFIFEYLNKEHIAYAFYNLNTQLNSAVKYFIGQELNLVKIDNENIFQFCLSIILPSIGNNLRYLSIGYPYLLLNYVKYIENYCQNLHILNIYCSSHLEDIRRYSTYFLHHHQFISFQLIYKTKIIDQDILHRLLNQYEHNDFSRLSLTSSINLHLSSMNDLILLKRFSECSYIPNGFYMIECVSTGQWLTDSKDDLCIMSKKLHRESIFSIKQIDIDQCTREYELYNEGTQRRLTVLIPYEEERWLCSSILSTHRMESSRSCSSFTFEKMTNDEQYSIRPCYSQAKRLQVSGKRIIISIGENENTLNHCFKLHRIS